ncbi:MULTISPECIES: response regulator transcription factor [unclassified Curtobacterium]|uniref:helix-turn-helix transcriptional regulator n=1 Tax=unclassified Curtobacterium TaxID=257496 RepID=UPI0037FA194A
MSTRTPAKRPSDAPAEFDAISSLVAASRLVDDAVAGALFRDDSARPLPGLPGDPLLDAGSDLVPVVRTRMTDDPLPAAFLWPRASTAGHDYVRVTSIVLAAAMAPGVRAVVLLSPPGDLRGLTARELEVLGLIVDGCSNIQIARELVITARTVATHVEHLLAKLCCATRTHAALRAQREGLYVPPPCTAAARRRGARHPLAETSLPEPRP